MTEKIYDKSGNHRCSICNKVSYEDIETNIGDYNPNLYFVHDPKDDTHFICGECAESIQEIREDYEWDDFWSEEEDDDDVLLDRLYEVKHIILKPNQPYIFTVDPGCKCCSALASVYIGEKS